jgi:hypothetical protein
MTYSLTPPLSLKEIRSLKVSDTVGEIFLNAGNPYAIVEIPQRKFPKIAFL